MVAPLEAMVLIHHRSRVNAILLSGSKFCSKDVESRRAKPHFYGAFPECADI